MSDDGSFEYESVQDVESIRAFLESLNKGFESGRIALSSDNDELTLLPQRLLKFKISARKKKDKTKMEIKISWKHNEMDDDGVRLAIES